MHFSLTDEQQMIVDTTRAFVENELYPHEAKVEQTGHLDMDLVREISRRQSRQAFTPRIFPRNSAAAGSIR